MLYVVTILGCVVCSAFACLALCQWVIPDSLPCLQCFYMALKNSHSLLLRGKHGKLLKKTQNKTQIFNIMFKPVINTGSLSHG